eukprot:1195755-Prorocentrum_minimum.AAC.2
MAYVTLMGKWRTRLSLTIQREVANIVSSWGLEMQEGVVNDWVQGSSSLDPESNAIWAARSKAPLRSRGESVIPGRAPRLRIFCPPESVSSPLLSPLVSRGGS